MGHVGYDAQEAWLRLQLERTKRLGLDESKATAARYSSCRKIQTSNPYSLVAVHVCREASAVIY